MWVVVAAIGISKTWDGIFSETLLTKGCTPLDGEPAWLEQEVLSDMLQP